MKQGLRRCFVALLIVVLSLPVFPAGVLVSAAAKKPSLSMSSMNLVGVGATSSIKLNNVDMSKVKRLTWYTQNEDVAIVEPVSSDKLTGKITAVGKGTTNVRIKITYKDGKVERPSCKVKVLIPATAVEINNAKDNEENNNRHVIVVGETYDFNRTLTPKNANDKTYWYIDNEEYATVNTSGVVTAKKPGFIRLEARASLTKAGAATSTVNDIINIEIVGKSAIVNEVVLVDTNTLKITFNNAIDPTTVIKTDKKLQDTIIITPKTDEKGVNASPLGDLTGSLSTDGKVLTITSTNVFNGLYGIHLSSNIKSTDGLNLNNYYENLSLYDTIKPTFKDYTVDETGLKVSINFSEPMDFTSMAVTGAKVVSSGHTALPATISTISEKTNYVVSKDKKSLIIDLTNVSSYDHNKMFSISLSGLKDLAGNFSNPYPLTVYFMADTTPKPQARLITIARTGYNTLTATFTRPIKTPGMMLLSNGDWINGVVDTEDNKKVNYTISSTAALISGIQKVSVSHWDSYNVSPSDTSASILTERMVDFTVDRSIPVLTKSELTLVSENGVDTHVLTLTYNKKVSVLFATGSFTTRIVTVNNDIYSNRLLGYTAVVKDNVVTLLLNKEQFTESGLYTITIPSGFVRDEYMNLNTAHTVQIRKDAAVSSALPAPKEVKQAVDNPNVVYVVFANKVDEVTAQNVSNYQILGTTIISAELTDNTANGATVKLTLLANSITTTTIYPIYINNITGYHNTYTKMEPYQNMILLNENKLPQITNVTFTYPNTITMTFDETITGTANFQVMQGSLDLSSGSIITGNTIIITLNNVPSKNVALRIIPTQYNSIKDSSGNVTTISERIIVPNY